MHRFTESGTKGPAAAGARSCMVAGVLVWLGTARRLPQRSTFRGERTRSRRQVRRGVRPAAPFAVRKQGRSTIHDLLGRAALGTNRAEKAKALFEQSLAARPGSIEAHLALGRAYYALRMYAEAKDRIRDRASVRHLPPDLLSQVQTPRRQRSSTRKVAVWSASAISRRVSATTASTTLSLRHRASATRPSMHAPAAVRAMLGNDGSLTGTLDDRYRYYDNRIAVTIPICGGNGAASRNIGESNLVLGARGRGAGNAARSQ